MATNCTNCGCSKISCGCGDTFLTTPPPCPTPVDCPEAQPCSEVFDAQCVAYTGLDIECGTDVIVATNDSVATALQNVVDYFCVLLGSMRAQSSPLSMDLIVPTVGTSLVIDGVTQIMSEVYDDDNAYNPLTGIWTCPATGKYNLSFYVHMSNETILVTTGFTSGMVIAGIVSSSGFYAVNTMSVSVPVRYIDITGQTLGMNITVGTQLKLNILNLTDVDYVTALGDVARFVVQRVE